MKTTVRRILSFICVVAIAAAYALVPAVAEVEYVNIALSATATASSESGEKYAWKANDGNTGEYWQAAGTTGTITLTWDTAVSIDYLYIRWGGGSAKEGGYTVQLSQDGTTFTDSTTASYSRDSQSSTEKHDTVTFSDAPITVKAIRLNITACDKSDIQLWEFEAYKAVEAEETVKEYTDGGSVRFFATSIPADAVGKTVTATYSITRDGATATETVEVLYAYNTIVLGETQITADIFGAEAGDYVTGIFVGNVRATDTISVVFEIAE